MGRDAEESPDFGFGEASRYAAHLDRGWAMLDRGDPAAARTSAEHAQEARPDDPDAAVLLGAIALAEGDPDGSLRAYERAIELDPEYLEPHTAAAQVCLYDLDDPARGLRYCLDALEVDVLSPFESIDVHLVAAECELAAQAGAEARRRLATLDGEPVLMSALRLGARPDLLEEAAPEDPDDVDAVAAAYLNQDADGDALDEEERVDRIGRALQLAFRLVRMRLDLDDLEAAAITLDELLRWYPAEPDAWYLSSEANHRRGLLSQACVAAIKTLELDHEQEVPEWVPSFAQVHRRTIELLKACSEPAIVALVDTGQPITVMVRDAPAPELIMEGVDPRVGALALAGRPMPEMPGEAGEAGEAEGLELGDLELGTPLQLTGLAVYRRNLSRFVRNAEHFDQELRLAILDELSAFVALPNEARQRLGLPPLPEMLVAPEEEPEPEEGKGERKKAKRARKRRVRAGK